MGASQWELHDQVVRGKSGLIDHILEMVPMVSSCAIYRLARSIITSEVALTANERL